MFASSFLTLRGHLSREWRDAPCPTEHQRPCCQASVLMRAWFCCTSTSLGPLTYHSLSSYKWIVEV